MPNDDSIEQELLARHLEVPIEEHSTRYQTYVYANRRCLGLDGPEVPYDLENVAIPLRVGGFGAKWLDYEPPRRQWYSPPSFEEVPQYGEYDKNNPWGYKEKSYSVVMANAKYIWDRLIAWGATPQAAAGMLGNFKRESSMIPGTQERGKPMGSGGWGLAQWTYGRRTRLIRYLESKGLPLNSLSGQVDFMIWELENTHKHVGVAMKDPSYDVDTITDYICNKYEGPAKDRAAKDYRLRAARYFYLVFGGGAR